MTLPPNFLFAYQAAARKGSWAFPGEASIQPFRSQTPATTAQTAAVLGQENRSVRRASATGTERTGASEERVEARAKGECAKPYRKSIEPPNASTKNKGNHRQMIEVGIEIRAVGASKRPNPAVITIAIIMRKLLPTQGDSSAPPWALA